MLLSYVDEFEKKAIKACLPYAGPYASEDERVAIKAYLLAEFGRETGCGYEGKHQLHYHAPPQGEELVLFQDIEVIEYPIAMFSRPTPHEMALYNPRTGCWPWPRKRLSKGIYKRLGIWEGDWGGHLVQLQNVATEEIVVIQAETTCSFPEVLLDWRWFCQKREDTWMEIVYKGVSSAPDLTKGKHGVKIKYPEGKSRTLWLRDPFFCLLDSLLGGIITMRQFQIFFRHLNQEIYGGRELRIVAVKRSQE